MTAVKPGGGGGIDILDIGSFMKEILKLHLITSSKLRVTGLEENIWGGREGGREGGGRERAYLAGSKVDG